MYVLLTVLFQAISFGAIQFRISEMLMMLPVLLPEAVPGLFIGCLLANVLGGGIWFDVLFGSVATLLAACLVRKLRARPLIAAAMPVLINGSIVGTVVYFAYVKAPGSAMNPAVLFSSMGTVALGEAVICYTLGLLLMHVLRRIPGRNFEN